MPPQGAAPAPTERRRVLVEAVSPLVEGGRYFAKRVVGDRIDVSCDLVSDGHDVIAGAVHYRQRAPTATAWEMEPLQPLGNDRFGASFGAGAVGTWEFVLEGWVDAFTTWRRGTQKKLEAGQDVGSELLSGALLLRACAELAQEHHPGDARVLRAAAQALEDASSPFERRFSVAAEAEVVAAAGRHADRRDATRTDPYGVVVDPPRARFSSWYEMFPRSAGAPGQHGTLRDCARRVPYVAEMGFDVLYLPPVHPIGRAYRKGPNNALDAGPADVGSPWAIGAAEGGHKAVHPDLGTLDDLRALVRDARAAGVEVAIDVALQASPDHPYVREHPEWFLHRPDGSIRYAENPPKKYQDVYPFDFACDAWESLWQELASIFLFWCEQGIRIFRVDNPHTKPLRFWEWCISRVKAHYPESIFLAEAFTRPKVMYALAKGGFTQSYTYFAWRHSKWEFTEYLQELTRPPVSDFYRPNFWPNTPDILTEELQFGGRNAFVQRLILAATLSSNYGIYGPPFELMEHVARPGAEEYLDNEKYQLRTWDIDRPDSLRDVIALVNRIRRDNPALQDNRITFHPTDNEQLLAFSKRSTDSAHVVLVVINLDAHHRQSGHVELDREALGLRPEEAFQVHDLLADARYRWEGRRAFVELDPGVLPASIFAVRRRVRTEQDFDYFL
ncbi:MAG TPA: alpha-1,4-glucan--maltose-1-phosphate maltosyltransferase [Polyangiaceae bacterium]|nr:alpha-1,4-glucan--maltose-1-phosphate maltosyltransferase [Polyangiaceae bacterium]